MKIFWQLLIFRAISALMPGERTRSFAAAIPRDGITFVSAPNVFHVLYFRANIFCAFFVIVVCGRM